MFEEIANEIEVVNQYIIIQNYRYMGRFSFSCRWDESLAGTYIPKNILQPIIENSILHGICPKADPGNIRLEINRREENVEIIIADDGVGMDEEQVRIMQESLDDPEIGKVDANGCLSVGMKNVYDRIKLNCGKEYGFRIESFLGVGTIVTYHLPVWEEPENVESSDRG